MTITLPLPLPEDVDLTGMEHMPLLVARLVGSRAWRRAKHWRGDGPGLGFCLLNLWMSAFSERPAGSLDGDDEDLADKARCDIAHWLLMKSKALDGWENIDGRWHHRVVSEIAWGLWMPRLRKRYENAYDSWRSAAKRASDKGRVPPEPPGEFMAWVSVKYPATFAYLEHLSVLEREKSSERPPDKTENPPDISKNPTDFGPKRSEARISPPVSPPPVDGGGIGQEMAAAKTDGKRWFARELDRINREFGRMVPTLAMNLQAPGIPQNLRLVMTFKGAWFEPGEPAIVMPSKRRSDALIAEHGEWLRHYWPDLRVRWQTVDEARRRKSRGETA